MTPVDQTRLYDPTNQQPPGNCWAACIASILSVSIEDLPDEKDFWKPGDHPVNSWPPYFRATLDWLRARGLSWLEVRIGGISRDEIGDVYCIISGPSPRDATITHSVVGLGSRIVHDPHPSRAGLIGPEEKWTWGYFVKTFVKES